MMNVQHDLKRVECAADMAAEFQVLTGTTVRLPQDLLDALQVVMLALGPEGLRLPDDRRRGLSAAINAKLKLGQPVFKQILDAAAEHGTFFNYHQKSDIQRAITSHDRAGFFRVLLRSSASPQTVQELSERFRPPTPDQSRQALQDAFAEDEKAHQICRSIFSAYAFASFQTPLLHAHLSGEEPGTYYSRFYDHLRHVLPRAFKRSCGLAYLKIDDVWLGGLNDERQQLAKVLTSIEALSQQLSNHCYMAVLLKPLSQGEALKWKLYADIVLYAEKQRAGALQKGYFRPDAIASQTLAYIPHLDPVACRFDLAHEGLFYKDCFVITYGQSSKEITLQSEPDLLLLFEKNERDETPIPCPACRSLNVQGNSYPVLGVRSWECNNLICPERSKYDRGNRYSLSSLIRQEAIEEEEATIPVPSLRLWKRDLVNLESEAAILQLLVRHYSLVDDSVLLVNGDGVQRKIVGRTLINNLPHQITSDRTDTVDNFFGGPYFQRFCINKEKRPSPPLQNLSPVKGVEVYCGDCFDVLQHLGDASVDGIVTSPPYYNAREYAQWPNIYCFLHDQYNIAAELHRVLKPGGLFLYNIFDYFDNENNIVFSAMGKKRMILGAYAINLFRRVGFELAKNVVWDKGEIEGKRNFNQGNHSPYYQAPFNCWEHVLVFSKGTPPATVQRLPFILRSQPVTKIVGGRNVLGHTAPFPKAVPDLLIDLLEPRSTVLDPFAGSMTTARTAFQHGLRSISIDYKEDYCRLGLRLLMEQEWDMFSEVSTGDFLPKQV